MSARAASRRWTQEEVRRVLALYLLTPFGQLHARNPAVIKLADELGRTPSAVALKACNLAALDDSLPRKGMANASRADRQVWRDFLDHPASMAAAFSSLPGMTGGGGEAVEGFAEGEGRLPAAGREDNVAPLEPPPEAGGERTAVIARRIGQDFFRRMILISYDHRCALTGIDDKRLLIASHIVAWKEAPQWRMHPQNGLCLNALHDRAFDRCLITFDEDYRLVMADDVPSEARRQLQRAASRLNMPKRFLPKQEFLEHHRRKFHARLRGGG